MTSRFEDLNSLQSILDAVPLPVFVKDDKSRFLIVNRSMSDLMGVPAGDLIGKSDFDFVPGGEAELFSAIDRQILSSGEIDEREEKLSLGGETHSVITRKQRARLPDGSYGIVACISDVTRLAETKRSWEMLFNRNPLPMWVFDRTTFRFLAVNEEAIRHYGYSREQFLSMTVVDIRPSEDAAAFRKTAKAMRKTYRASRVWRHLKANGQTMLVTPHSCTIEFEGRKAELVAVHDVTQLKNAESYISYIAAHDGLTGLPNRSALTEHLDFLARQSRPSHEAFALLCMDLVRFTNINRLFGAAVGDGLLKKVAEQVALATDGAFIARLGGDRFGVVLSRCDTPTAAAGKIDRILSAVGEAKEILGSKVEVEAYMAIAFCPHDGPDASSLITNAESALARAKANGPGKLHAFDTAAEHRLEEFNALKRDLLLAFERDEFELVYQPQTLVSGEIIGFEALLRWHHPERGMVSPIDFISLAEQTGQIAKIGEWVLRRACEEAASWISPLQIAINLSPIQIQDEGFPQIVAQVLEDNSLSPERLEFEVTESTAFDDFSRANSVLVRLKSLGIRIAVDDFGTGYSSLSYLHDFPVDKIKIDRSFVCRLGESEKSAAIVRAMIQLALTLSMSVTAEGVETVEQLAFLANENCSFVQGYLYGKPLPIADYARQLALKNGRVEDETLEG